MRKLSRDTMRGLVARAKTGLWPGGPIPFGFDRLILDDGTPKRVVRDLPNEITAILDPDSGDTLESLDAGRRYRKQDHEQCTLIPSEPGRVCAVRQLFADYAAGKPTRRLRDEINKQGFKTSRGRPFTVQTLLPMLENPAYVGRCVYNRRTFSKWHRYAEGTSVERQDEGFEKRPESDWVIHENAWPSIVEVETFEKVQARRTESKKRASHHRGNAMKSNYLLTGLGFCSVCGGKLTGTTQTSGKGYKTRYFTCSKYAAGYKDECQKRYTVPANLVEDHIVSLIVEDLSKYRDDKQLKQQVEDELTQVLDTRVGTRNRLTEQAEALEGKLVKLREHLISMDPATAKSVGLYDEAQELSEERTRIETEIENAETSDAVIPSIQDVSTQVDKEFGRLQEVFDAGTVEEKRELIGSYVNRVEAFPERQTVSISLYPGVLSQMVAGVGFEPTTFGL